jgi:hypothetical protein
MEEQAQDLKNHLKEKFGNAVEFSYVDVQSKGMKKYPGILKILGVARLPLTVINDEPQFHGGLSVSSIEDAISELLA